MHLSKAIGSDWLVEVSTQMKCKVGDVAKGGYVWLRDAATSNGNVIALVHAVFEFRRIGMMTSSFYVCCSLHAPSGGTAWTLVGPRVFKSIEYVLSKAVVCCFPGDAHVHATL